MIVKRKISLCFAFVLLTAITAFSLTACSLLSSFGKNNNNNSSTQIEKPDKEKTEPSEVDTFDYQAALKKAALLSLMRLNYSIESNAAKEGKDGTKTTIEIDESVVHIIVNSKQKVLGIVTNVYAETYFFEQDDKYYTSARVSKTGNFLTTEIATKEEFASFIKDYLLKSYIGDFSVDTSNITYTGSRTEDAITVIATSVKEEDGQKKERKAVCEIKGGLIDAVNITVSEYDKDDTPTVVETNEIAIEYDIGEVKLDESITVE